VNQRPYARNNDEHCLAEIIQHETKRNLEDSGEIDPGEFRRGHVWLDEDQITAHEAYQYSGNRNKTA
jgi:hypothetical protein